MKELWCTIYENNIGTYRAVFKEKMTLQDAEELGIAYCNENGYKYVRTINRESMNWDE